jgi:hypothetical protein
VDSVTHSARLAFSAMAEDAGAPHVLMCPAISVDGNQWCALYGANLHDGVAGFGDTPAKAMRDFDKNWLTQRIAGVTASPHKGLDPKGTDGSCVEKKPSSCPIEPVKEKTR